jgi:hypothetical protein
MPKRALALCLLLACSKHADHGPATEAAEVPPSTTEANRGAGQAPAPASGDDEKTGATKQQDGQPRKIVRSGELRVVVEDFDAARVKLDAVVGHAGGFVANLSIAHSGKSVSAATFTLRVPSARFDEVVRALRPLGEVQDERTTADDISETYYDLESRLKNARVLEARMLDLVKSHSGPIADLLQIERELGRVREDIERMDGKMRSFDNLVAMSTLTVNVDTRVAYVAAAPVGFGDRAAGRLGRSWDAVTTFFSDLALGAIELVPWIPVLLAPLAGAIWLWRRRRARVRARAAAPA